MTDQENNVDSLSEGGYAMYRVPAQKVKDLSSTPQVYVGSLCWPFSFGRARAEFTPESVSAYWAGVAFEPKMEPLSCAQYIFKEILDCNLSKISDVEIIELLEQKIHANSVPFVIAQSSVKHSWGNMILAARALAMVLRKKNMISQLKMYNEIREILSTLGPQDRAFFIQLLEKFHGPLTNMASQCTQKNIRAMMDKLKIANAIPLIHQIFSSPTVLGKTSGIWRLLELFGIPYADLPTDKVEDLVGFLYRTFNWMMTKTILMKDSIAAGYKWVKAKLTNEQPEEQVVEEVDPTPVVPQAKQDGTCYNCSKPMLMCCSLCVRNWCEECTACECPEAFKSTTVCRCMSDNDCFYFAMSAQNGVHRSDLKKHFWDMLSRPEGVRKIKDYLEKHNLQDFYPLDQVMNNTIAQLNCDRLCESETLLAFTILYDIDLRLFSDEPGAQCKVALPSQLGKDKYFLYLKNCHFIPHTPIPDADINSRMFGMPAEEAEVKFNVTQEKVNNVTITTVPVPESNETDSDSSDDEDLLTALKKAGCTVSGAQSISTEPVVIEPIKTPTAPLPLDAQTEGTFDQFLDEIKDGSIGKKILDWLKSTSALVINWFKANPLVAAMISLAIGIASFFGVAVGTIQGKVGIGKYLAKLQEASKTIYYTERGMSSIKTAFSEVMSVAKDMLGVSDNSIVSDFKQRVSDSFDLANEMLTMATQNPGEFINDASKFVEFRTQMEEIKKVYKDLVTIPNIRDLNTIQPIWYSLSKTYYELQQLYNKFMASLSIRQEPVCVWLWGKSDIGKSSMCDYLIARVNKKMKRDMKVFTVSNGPEFWNCFAQQEHIKIDDFNCVEGKDGDTDSQMVFNLVTTAAYNPNQAAMQDKNTMANPRFLWVNSNYPSVAQNSTVSNVEAFERRRHVFAHLSWPEHEDTCRKGDYTCHHWVEYENGKPKLDKDGKMIKKINKSNYDHLTITLCDPNVSENLKHTTRLTDRRSKKLETTFRTKSDNDIIAAGERITVDQLVDRIVELEAEKRASFEDHLKSVGITAQSLVRWEEKPNVLICGPPGTGKSEIFKKMINVNASLPDDKKKRLRFINTEKEFMDYLDRDCMSAGKSLIVFDDLSTHVTNQEYFKKFMQKFKERYDVLDDQQDTWIIGCNKPTFEKGVETMCSLEDIDMFYRRCLVVHTTFKRYRKLLLKKVYTSADVVALGADKCVEYKIATSKDFVSYTQDSLVSRLLSFETSVKEVPQKTQLLETVAISDPTSAFIIDASEDSFMHSVNFSSFAEMYSIIFGGGTKIKTTNKDKMELGKAFLKTIRSAKDLLGTEFDTMDDLILQAWNKDLFTEFAGEKIVFKLQDTTYVLDCIGEVRCYRVTSAQEAVEYAVEAMGGYLSTVVQSDMLFAKMSELPPWFTLSTEIIHTVVATAASALAAAGAVVDQVRMYKAVRENLQLQKVVQDVGDVTKESMVGHLQAQADSIRYANPSTYHPGSHLVRSTQYADIDEDNIFNQTAPDNPKPNPRKKPYKQSPVVPTDIKKNLRKFKQVDAPTTGVAVEEKVFKQSVVNMGDEEAHKQAVIKQVVSDPSIPAILNKVAKNMCEIHDLTGKKLCYGIFVKDNICTTVGHLLDTYSESSIRIKTIDGKLWPCKVKKHDITIDRLDLEVTDKKFPNMTSIVNHFPIRNKIVPANSQVLLAALNQGYVKNIPTLILRSYRFQQCLMTSYQGDVSRKYYHLSYVGHRAGFSLTGIQTFVGDCGGILILSDPTWETGKIIGMHVAASQSVGYARHIYAEHYEDIPKPQCVPSPFLNAKYMYETPGEEYIGKVYSKPFLPTKTKIFRNWIPVGPKLYEPSPLTRNDPRCKNPNIMYNEAMRWCEPSQEFPAEWKDLLSRITYDLADWYADHLISNEATARVLTRTEAINKLSGSNKSEPINVHTSMGFPWNTLATGKGKYDLITIDENGIRHFNKQNPKLINELYNECNKIQLEARGRCVSSVVFQMVLKDQASKIGKDPRTIVMAPLHYQIEYRRRLHAIQAAVRENFHILSGKVGINPLSFDWHSLFLSMSKVSLFGFDVDYKGWDFCINPFFIHLLAEFWKRLSSRVVDGWTDEDSDVVDVLYSKIMCFTMLVGQHIYQATQGIPSGYPGTADDNSIINLIKAVFIWYKIMEEHNPKLCHIAAFFEDVAHACYGDDEIQTVSEYASEWYNGVTVAEWARKLGFHPTPADKTGEIVPLKPLTEMTFLSRSFKQWNGYWIGPLLYDHLCKGTWWIHDNRSHNFWESPDEYCRNSEAVVNSYESHLYEAALHGEEVFKIFHECAMRVWRITQIRYPPTYHECMQRMFGDPANEGELKGVTFVQLNCLQNWKHTPPPKVRVFKNRTSYSFGVGYEYKGARHPDVPIPGNLQQILEAVNRELGVVYNSILVNIYPRGGSIPWHKDDEPNLELSQGVFGVTIYGNGKINFKHHEKLHSFHLEPNLGYHMDAYALTEYYHSRTDHMIETMSFTFRRLN